jgi:hypothetical protein
MTTSFVVDLVSGLQSSQSLPSGSALEKTARNEAILGGAFHRHFDDQRTFVVWWEGLIRRVNSFAGPLFGDQSIFVRSSVLPFTASASIWSRGNSSRESIPETNVFEDAFHAEI